MVEGLVLALVGTLMLGMGWAVRFGTYRRWQTSLGPSTWVSLHNAPFVWLPLGAAIMLIGASGMAIQLDERPTQLILAFAAAACALFAASARWVRRPPEFIVPAGLSDYARAQVATAGEDTLLMGFALVSALAGVFFVGALVIGTLGGI